MVPFTVDIPVRFQHCDPAGLVFYPRYFEMLNQVVEDWFAEALAASFRRLHGSEGRGVPAVRLEADFLRPSRLGDVLRFALTVLDVGCSSVTLTIIATCGEEERLRASVVLAYVALDRMRAERIPGDLRAAMAPYADPGAIEGRM